MCSDERMSCKMWPFNLFHPLSRIVITGFLMNWAFISLFYCKFRLILIIICIEMSFTCLCLAIIDQYFATCSLLRWSNIKPSV
jgi:hypothetical protein